MYIPVRHAAKTSKMHTFVKLKDGKFRHLAYMCFEGFDAEAKVCSRYQGNIGNVKVLAPLLTQSLPLKSCLYWLFP